MKRYLKLTKSSDLVNLPNGIEYEQLMRNLKKQTYEKYNITNDYRKYNNVSNKSVILNPGLTIEYETNLFPAYPQSDCMYESGTSWIGGLYE